MRNFGIAVIAIICLAGCGESNDQFFGTWSGDVTCETGQVTVDMTVSEGASSDDLNVVAFGGDVSTTGVVNGDSFTISEGDLSGTFTRDGSLLRANMLIPIQGGAIETCEGLLEM